MTAVATGKLYVLQVDSPFGKNLVGPWYRDKAAAKSWVSFTRAMWHCRVTVRTFTRKQAEAIQANGGQLKAGEQCQPC